MPTRFGSIWAQYNGYHWSTGPSHTITVRPSSRDITAASAISLYGTTRNDHWGEAGVFRIVAGGSFEQFDPPLPRIQRDDVTEIVFRLRVSDCTVWARHKIDYWE